MVSHQGGLRARAPRLGADGKPVPQPAELVLSPAQLDAYVGRYRISPRVILTVTREGDTLLTQATGEPAATPIFSERADHFEYELLDVDLDFERDRGGKVVAVQARMGRNEVRAERMP
jgi:hypothetical protein